jgi:hypothetical protein
MMSSTQPNVQLSWIQDLAMLRSSQELMGRDLRSREGGELLLFVVDVSSAKAANHSMSDEGIYF